MDPVFGSTGRNDVSVNKLNIRDTDWVERYVMHLRCVCGGWSGVNGGGTYMLTKVCMCDLLQVRDQLPKGETRRLPRVLNRETAGLTRGRSK